MEIPVFLNFFFNKCLKKSLTKKNQLNQIDFFYITKDPDLLFFKYPQLYLSFIWIINTILYTDTFFFIFYFLNLYYGLILFFINYFFIL